MDISTRKQRTKGPELWDWQEAGEGVLCKPPRWLLSVLTKSQKVPEEEQQALGE